jgi:hypothetical protein
MLDLYVDVALDIIEDSVVFSCCDWCILNFYFLQLIIQQHNCVSISYTINLMKILLHQRFTVYYLHLRYITEIKLVQGASTSWYWSAFHMYLCYVILYYKCLQWQFLFFSTINLGHDCEGLSVTCVIFYSQFYICRNILC